MGLRSVERAAVDEVERSRESLVRLATELVQQPSTTGAEQPAAEAVHGWLVQRGFQPYRHHIRADSETAQVFPAEGDLSTRPNVGAVWQPLGDTGRRIVLNGHLDTVPVADAAQWRYPPCAGVVADGRIWGRGAADMKAGLAAGMVAMHCLRAVGAAPAASVELQCVVGEESGGIGTAALLADGPAPDCAVVLEPTSNRVVTACGGALPFTVEVEGVAAHISTPWEGVSAFEKLLAVHRRLTQFWAERERGVTHPLFRALPAAVPTAVGTAEAGSWRLTVPEYGVLRGRLGALPQEDLGEVRDAFAAALAALAEDDSWFAGHPAGLRWDGPGFPGWETGQESALAHAFLSAARDLGSSGDPAGVTYGTDASKFAGGGSEVLLFGPGAVAEAHARDEFVPISELIEACKVLCVALLRLAGGEQPEHPGEGSA